MEEEKKQQPQLMTEAHAVALAIAGLYGEALRAQERGDFASSETLRAAFVMLDKLSQERGMPQLTHSLCDTMVSEYERRAQERGDMEKG
jgi:hypothetical protein